MKYFYHYDRHFKRYVDEFDDLDKLIQTACFNLYEDRSAYPIKVTNEQDETVFDQDQFIREIDKIIDK